MQALSHFIVLRNPRFLARTDRPKMAAKEEEEEESLVFVQLSGVSSEDENFLEDFQGSSSFLVCCKAVI